MDITQLLLELVIKLFEGNLIDLLFYLSTLFLFIWLYKEFRNRTENDEKIRKEKIENILIVLFDLQFELQHNYRGNDNFVSLQEKLVKAYPFLSYDLSKDIIKFFNNISNEEIETFIKKLNKEIDIYKANQPSEFYFMNQKSFSQTIEHYYMSKFRPIILPFMLTIFSLLIILIILLIMIVVSQTNSYLEKYLIIQELINSIIFLSALVAICDLFMLKKIEYNWKTWFYLAVFLVLSVVFLILFSKWIFSAPILFLFYFISAIYISIRKSSNINEESTNTILE